MLFFFSSYRSSGLFSKPFSHSSYYFGHSLTELRENFPMSSSLCSIFSLRMTFCLRMFCFSFCMFSIRSLIVSIKSLIFSISSSRSDDFSSAFSIFCSIYSTSSATYSSSVCFRRPSKLYPLYFMADWNLLFLTIFLIMFVPLISLIFLTFFLTLFSN